MGGESQVAAKMLLSVQSLPSQATIEIEAVHISEHHLGMTNIS